MSTISEDQGRRAVRRGGDAAAASAAGGGPSSPSRDVPTSDPRVMVLVEKIITIYGVKIDIDMHKELIGFATELLNSATKDGKTVSKKQKKEKARKTMNTEHKTMDTLVLHGPKIDYNTTISEIEYVARSIGVKKGDCDGRLDSAMKETPFLNEMKKKILEKHPDWEVVISPPRASCDIMVNSIRINLKLTDCKSSDNSVNKPSIYYSITGLTTYPYSSNWNTFHDWLIDAKTKSQIKKQRYKPSEYHYLVKNKLTGDVLLKPIFDIHTYVPNASNDLQVNWKNEFAHSEYHTEEANYLKKVHSLLDCIQKSVKEMIERTKRFAEADVGSLLT